MIAVRNLCLVALVALCCGALYAQPELDVSYEVAATITTPTAIADGGTIDLGDNPSKAQQTVTLRLENTGTSVLTLTGTSPNFLVPSGAQQVNYTVQQPGSGTINNGSFVDLNVFVTPNDAGGWQLLITIPNDDSNEGNYTITLKGTAGKKKKDESCSTQEGSKGGMLLLFGLLSAALVGLRLHRSRA